MTKKRDWFKPKNYPHIGLPLEPKDRHRVECYVRNPSKIAHHPFLPLLRREQISYRYKEKDEIKKRTRKPRPISYASHLDAQIYSFYSQLLEKRYEKYLSIHGYGECVTAYRSLARPNGKGNMCNLDLAKDAFDHIRDASTINEQVVIIADIKSFFDNLNHQLLKLAWKEVSEIASLPVDEYSVFKHVIRYAFVNAQDLFNIHRTQIICQQKTKITNRTLASMRYFRDKNAIAFCSKDAIEYIRKSGMIHRNKDNKGIPQGLPISAVLANIYMWRFDRQLFDYMKSIGGYYRRYSDDIIISCNVNNSDEVQSLLKKLISEVGLEITSEKTKLFSVTNEGGKRTIVDKNTHKPSVIEYLGLSFDGAEIRLKNKSISRYYHKLKRTINAKTHFAIKKTDKTEGVLFVQQILRKFTPIGSKRHLIFKRSKNNPSVFINTGLKSFGNFWTYVNKASIICKSPSIHHQLSRNRPILRKRIYIAKRLIKRLIEEKRVAELNKYSRTYH